MRKILLGAAALCLAAWIAGCGTPSVEVVQTEKTAEPLIYEAEIRPEALHELPVVPAVSGKIISKIPQAGAAVRAGELLLQLDSSRYEAEIAELRTHMTSSVSVSPAADTGAEAALLRQGIITRAEYERIMAKKNAGTSYVSSNTASQEALAGLRQAVAACTIYAPIDGIVGDLYISGDNMAAAGVPILVLRQNTPIIADVQIPAMLDELLAEAKDAKTLTVSITDAAGKRVWYGELKKQPNESGDEYTVYKVQADNPDGAIELGSAYRLKIDGGRSVEGYVVPESAFVREDQVKVVNAAGLVDVRTVTAMGAEGARRLIVSGLEEGDRVIAKPTADLALGMEVSVK